MSDAGVVWAAELEKQVKKGLVIDQGQAQPWAGSSDARRADREVERARASLAWQQWKTVGEVSVRAAMQLFRIDDYADARMRDLKVARLRRLVGEDNELSQLVEIAATMLATKE